MTFLNRFFFILSVTAVLVAVHADTAQAYIDPGSGSYLLQFLVAGLLGGLFALKMYWKKMKAKFSDRFSKKETEDIEPEL